MPVNDEAARIEELEAGNRRLRLLLDRKNAPAELRHRLNSTLAMLRTIIRKSAETHRDIHLYVGHVEDRLNAIARAQTNADMFGEVEIGTLLANELLQYGLSEGERVHLAGPTVQLQPRAGQVFALAVHELAVNALEHGALTIEAGRIDVAWDISSATAIPRLTFAWNERGLAQADDGSRRGFGTKVLTRMLPYELDAETSLSRDGDGVRCIIRFDLTDRIGRVDNGKPLMPV